MKRTSNEKWNNAEQRPFFTLVSRVGNDLPKIEFFFGLYGNTASRAGIAVALNSARW